MAGARLGSPSQAGHVALGAWHQKLLTGAPTQSPRGASLHSPVKGTAGARVPQLAEYPPPWASKPPQLLLRQAPPSFSLSHSAQQLRPELGMPLPPTAG